MDLTGHWHNVHHFGSVQHHNGLEMKQFTTIGQIKNTLQEVGLCQSQTSREDFTRVNTGILGTMRQTKYHLISEAWWW